MLKQNKGTGTLLEPEMGKIPKQGDKPDTAYMNFLYLGKEVFQALGSSQVIGGVLKYCIHETAFPNNSLLELLD